MLKKILLILFCILISNSGVFAESLSSANTPAVYAETQTKDILTKLVYYRTSIYDSLQLSEEQVKRVKELDDKLYAEVKPGFYKMTLLAKKIEDLANSGNCTKKAVNTIKKEIKSVENELNPIKNKYDKEFKAVLTSEQKSKYRKIRKQKRAEFKQEMKKEIERQRAIIKG